MSPDPSLAQTAPAVNLPEPLAVRVRSAWSLVTAELLAARGSHAYWTGELSSSALATATATAALAVVQRASGTNRFRAPMDAGLAWLAAHANPDGGWGDTTRSLSNLSTTVLGWAAFAAASHSGSIHRLVTETAKRWIQNHAGGLDPERLARAVIARYGRDRTFSVPILTTCALSGVLGDGPEAWRHVIPLPFELAACPPAWFAALRLPVVSYALPALIAIGQARHHHRPSRNPITRTVRELTRRRTLALLTRIQPANGGFLEATPLTSFVTMSLAGSGQENHPVVAKGLQFLLLSQRPDGSWPIDTNLATWVTTLSVNALAGGLPPALDPAQLRELRSWLRDQQHLEPHPYTQAAPGGWAWTDLPGGVPDADDTAGALLALRSLGPLDEDTRRAAIAGLRWLLGLRNRDGGIPTFCRGWGALPFDRSSPDLTAHAIRAWLAWLPDLPPELQAGGRRAVGAALSFLKATQHADGAWLPLWFGNQHAADDANPTYGTSRVLCALAEVLSTNPPGAAEFALPMAQSATSWLVRAQNQDGGWGGQPGVASSIEETALAVEALAAATRSRVPVSSARTLEQGVACLVQLVESGAWRQPTPIGFYFARLWYFEKLYPLIFTTAALSRLVK